MLAAVEQGEASTRSNQGDAMVRLMESARFSNAAAEPAD
jgi:hypothetical protein